MKKQELEIKLEKISREVKSLEKKISEGFTAAGELLKSTDFPFLLIDSRKKVLDQNDALAELTGSSSPAPESILSKSNLRRFNDAVKKASSGKIRSIKLKVISSTNCEVACSVLMLAEKLPEERYKKIYCLFIPELDKSSGDSKESSGFLAALVKKAPIYIYVFDIQQNKTIYLNMTVAEYLGYSTEEAEKMGENFVASIFHPDDFSRAPELFKRFETAKDEDILISEYRLKARTGKWRWMRNHEVILSRDSDGKVRNVIGYVMDIDEAKRAMESLEESREIVSLAFDNSPDSILILERKSLEIIEVNDTFVKLTGKSKETLVGKKLEPTQLKLEESTRSLINSLSSGKIQRNSIDTKVWYKDKAKWVIFSVNPIKAKGEDAVLINIRDITARKESEEKIQTQEEKYRRLFEKMINGFAYCKIIMNDRNEAVDFEIIESNKVFAGMFAKKPEEINGKTVLEIVPDLKKDEFDWIGTYARVALDNEEIKFDQYYEPFDIWFSVSAYSPKPGYFVILYDNITDRKKMEKKLQLNETKYKELFDNIGSGVAIYEAVNNGENFRFVDTNKTAEKISRMKRQDVVGRLVTDVFPSVASFGLLDVFREVYRTGKPVEYPENYYSDGRFSGWLENYIYKLPSGEVVAVYEDVTKEKIAEENIKKSKLLLERLISSLNESVLIIDPAAELIESANYKTYEIFGYEFNDLESSPVSGLFVNPRSYRLFKEKYFDSFNSGEYSSGEYTLKRKNGTDFEAEYFVSPLYDKGELYRIIMVFRDITERKEYERMLKEAKDRAVESDKLKSVLLENMSHEIRTPMNGIIGFASVLNKRLQDSSLQRMSENILKSSKRLMNTLAAILDLSLLESEKSGLFLENFDLSEYFSVTRRIYQNEAQQKGLEFNFDIKTDDLLIETDKEKFALIFENIVDNAVKFTAEGSVNITVSRKKKGSIEYISFSVKDTGIGIAEKDIPLIYQEFRQLSEGKSRSYEGTGLGLSLVKKIVELMQGHITVKSEPGEGSEFTVMIPVVYPDEMAAQFSLDADEQKPDKDKQPSVLIIEDNRINREIIHMFLEDICNLDDAETGERAVKKCKEKKYDILLLDINLGAGINGIESIRIIREIPGYENVPIVAVTGYTLSADKELFQREGIGYYVAKPFEEDEIRKVISNVLSG